MNQVNFLKINTFPYYLWINYSTHCNILFTNSKYAKTVQYIGVFSCICFNIPLCCRWAILLTNNSNSNYQYRATKVSNSRSTLLPPRTNTREAGPRVGGMFTPSLRGHTPRRSPRLGPLWPNRPGRKEPWSHRTMRIRLHRHPPRPGGVAEAGWRVVGICGGRSVSGSTLPNQPFRPATPTKSRTALTAMPGKRSRRMFRTMLPTAGHF